MKKKVLVLGGYGTFGRRISRELAGDPDIDCIIGGSSEKRAGELAAELRADWRCIDIDSPNSVDNALRDVFAVVNAAGPSWQRDYALPEHCARHGVHYVDLADGRVYVKGFGRLHAKAERGGSLLVSGASAVPAISNALVESVRADFDEISEIHGYLSLGDRYPRGLGLQTLLGYVGSSIRLRENGKWRTAYGWTESRVVRLPGRAGRRRMFLCDVPDLDIFPERYQAKSVSFRAGLRSPLMNLGLSLLGWGRRRGLIRKELTRLAGPLVKLGRLVPDPGDVGSVLGVTVRGAKGEQARERNVFLLSRDHSSPAILVSPAVALVRKWVRHGVASAGATACVGLLSLADLKQELLRYDIVLVLN